jgi:hypothetical protein
MLFNSPKIYLIYHKDQDGYASAAIVYFAFLKALNKKSAQLILPDTDLQIANFMPDAFCFIPITYGEDFECDRDFDKNSIVVILDFSFPPEILHWLYKRVGLLILCDHHKSFIESYNDFLTEKNIDPFLSGVLSDKSSGCVLTWGYFMGERPLPKAINLIGERDIWKNTDKLRWEAEVTPFFYYMQTQELDMASEGARILWESLLFSTDLKLLSPMIETGGYIYKYLKFLGEQTAKAIYPVILDNHNILCLNASGDTQLAFETHKDYNEVDATLSFTFKGNGWALSIRTIKPYIDVTKDFPSLAARGHKSAGGGFLAQMPEEIIKLREIKS